MTLVHLATSLPSHWGAHDGHMWDDHMGSGWMWLWGALVMLAVLGAVALVVWLTTRGSRTSPDDGARRARDILGERYARGELSTEEYHDRLEHLR